MSLGTVIAGGLSAIASLFGAKESHKAQQEANEANLRIANMNNDTSFAMAEMNNAAQKQMLRENNQFNRDMALEMFNLENAYNAPIEQVKRLKEAGINPAVYFAGGSGTSAGNGDASTPQASSSGISPSMPALTTPMMQPLPSVAAGAIQGISQLAAAASSLMGAKKSKAEADSITATIQETINKLKSESKYNAALEEYQDLQNTLFSMTFDSHVKGVALDLQKKNADYVNALLEGDVKSADATYKSMLALLTDTQNKNLEQQSPLIIANLKKQRELLSAQIGTEQAKQSDLAASARKTIAEAEGVEITNEMLPDKLINELTVQEIEIVGRVLSEGRSKSVPELMDQLLMQGVRKEFAKAIAGMREQIRKKYKK